MLLHDETKSHYDWLKSSDFSDSSVSAPTVKGEPCLLKMLPRVQVACALEDWVQVKLKIWVSEFLDNFFIQSFMRCFYLPGLAMAR